MSERTPNIRESVFVEINPNSWSSPSVKSVLSVPTDGDPGLGVDGAIYLPTDFQSGVAGVGETKRFQATKTFRHHLDVVDLPLQVGGARQTQHDS